MKNDPHVTQRRAFSHKQRNLSTKVFNTFQENPRDFL
jgi:hypothetical protein